MDPKNYAHYWCTQLVETLIDQGADHFFLAPGSRSTPLISAVVRNPRAHVATSIDERCLGFMALGYGKCAQKPGVIIVTSGTAVGNLYPSVIESYLSAVPMLVISADRPYELRDCGANQTINQTRMFEHHCLRSFDLAPPSPIVPLSMSLAIVEQAFHHALGPQLGPVHLNVQLREPVSNLPHVPELPWSPELRKEVSPLARVMDAAPDVKGLADAVAHKRGVFLVGELMPSDVQEKICALAKKWSWPIIADVTSNMRYTTHENVIHHADLALLDQAFLAELNNVDVVVKFGARILSKRLWAWLEKTPVPALIAVSESYERIDHVARFCHVHVQNVARTVDGLLKTTTAQNHDLASLKDRVQNVSDFVAHYFETHRSNEAYLAARLIANLDEPTNLFVSSSMPIRDLDQFPTQTSQPLHVFANRGASGIDGVISSSIGMAIADDKPGILLIGDMAFLHDSNALMALKQTRAPLLIVVINNNGGVIFHFLPIASEKDVLTPYIESPHETDIAALCSAHNVAHSAVRIMNDFDQEMAKFFRERTSRVIEVVVDKTENVAAHRHIYAALAKL